jgi:PAS domain-containing protein
MEWLSDEIEVITGYPASDFIDSAVRTFASVEHPDDHEYVAQSVMKSVATGKPFALEYRLVHRDGSVRWVLERGQAQEAGDGRWWLDGAIFDIVWVALTMRIWLAQHADLPEGCRAPVAAALAELRSGLAELRDLRPRPAPGGPQRPWPRARAAGARRARRDPGRARDVAARGAAADGRPGGGVLRGLGGADQRRALCGGELRPRPTRRAGRAPRGADRGRRRGRGRARLRLGPAGAARSPRRTRRHARGREPAGEGHAAARPPPLS